MNSITLKPIAEVNGDVQLPGSKSLSNRVLLLAALAQGTTVINNLLDSEDSQYMLAALKNLGVNIELSPCKTRCVVEGRGSAFSTDESLELYLGNAGTAMRPLCAALTLGKGLFTLTGDPRMQERPIRALVDSLLEGGASIQYQKSEGYPPLSITADGLDGGNIAIDASVSSQFLTALLIALPMAKNDSTVNLKGELVSKPYIDITLDVMKKFGIPVQHNNYQQFRIKGSQIYRSPGEVLVEGDASSASYFLAAGAIKGGRVVVRGIGRKSIQGDIHLADVLERMGARVEWGDDYIAVERGDLIGVDMDMNNIPDAAMAIATTALFARGTTTIRNIYNWRVKETDRLKAMSTELRKAGALVEEGNDYISITPPDTIKHAEIDTYNDHRMAMSFSLLALSPESVTINDPECTAKTFPDYFDKLEQISC